MEIIWNRVTDLSASSELVEVVTMWDELDGGTQRLVVDFYPNQRNEAEPIFKTKIGRC